MFSRLDASIRSELTAIEIRERQAEEDKRLRRDAAVSVLTFIGVPVGFLVAFFGINATQVRNGWSIFSMHHYWPVYLAAGLLALAPLVAFAVLNGRALRRSRQDRQERQARLRGNSEDA